MARKFGLEVEYGGSVDRALAELRAAGLTSATYQHGYVGHSDHEWIVKTDASVSRGGEMVGPPLNFDDPDQRGQVNRAIAALKASGAACDVQAGIHVHIDCSDLTGEQIANVARTFTKFEDIIYRIASSGWRTLRPSARQYCKPLTDQQIRGLARAKSTEQVQRAYFGHNRHVGHGDPSRYYGLNLQSWFYRGTVEFRVFNSSLNADRIQAYIAMCMAIVQDARNDKKRSVNKAYRLGGMLSGTTNPESAYHRFQQVMRYECGMDLADYKLMNKCWKDSVPQAAIAASAW